MSTTPTPPSIPVAGASGTRSTRETASVVRSAAAGRSMGDAGIRVLCVDDHAVLVEGLKAQFALDDRVCFVGHLPDASMLLDEVERLKPDLVLLDIEMPGPDVFEMADRLRHMHPRVRIVFLSAHIRDGYITAAYKCGAWGYFAKGDGPEDIVAGLTEVARSPVATFVMGPKVRQRCAPNASPAGMSVASRGAPPATRLHALTARELEVLRLIGKGLSRNEIAAELSRSAKTIDGHQERIMKKLGARSRAELVRVAISEGFAEA